MLKEIINTESYYSIRKERRDNNRLRRIDRLIELRRNNDLEYDDLLEEKDKIQGYYWIYEINNNNLEVKAYEQEI